MLRIRTKAGIIVKNTMEIGDYVISSPAGYGVISSVTTDGLPIINEKAVDHLVIKATDTELCVFDLNNTYESGNWSLILSSKQTSLKTTNTNVITSNCYDAINFCITVCSLPCKLYIDFNLSEAENSIAFIDWLINKKQTGELQIEKNFSYELLTTDKDQIKQLTEKLNILLS